MTSAKPVYIKGESHTSPVKIRPVGLYFIGRQENNRQSGFNVNFKLILNTVNTDLENIVAWCSSLSIKNSGSRKQIYVLVQLQA